MMQTPLNGAQSLAVVRNTIRHFIGQTVDGGGLGGDLAGGVGLTRGAQIQAFA